MPKVRIRTVGRPAEGSCVQLLERRGQKIVVGPRRGHCNIEVLRNALSSVCLHGDSTNGHVVNLVFVQDPEELAGIEPAGHLAEAAFFCDSFIAARSSDANRFQLRASSNRSAIGRLRDSSTASLTS